MPAPSGPATGAERLRHITGYTTKEHLNAPGLASDFRKKLKKFEKNPRHGFTYLERGSDEDNMLVSPVQGLIWDYASAAAASFEYEYGYQFELERLKEILKRTRSIMLFKDLQNPNNENQVRDAIYQFLRILYDDTEKNAHIGQPGKTYMPDIGIRHLRAAVEYKYADNANEVNKAVDGIYADIPAYRGSRDWKKFFAVIYMTDEHVPIPELEKRFQDFPQTWFLIPVIGSGERKRQKGITQESRAL